MRYNEIFESDNDTLKLPDIKVNDIIMVGKFKNRKATIKGFKKDDHNQPVLKTNKGDQKLFKPRIVKLMKENALSPSDRFEDAISDRFAKLFPNCRVDIHQISPTEIEIVYIQVNSERGVGTGNKIMHALTELADHLGITLYLSPATDADPEEGPDYERLREWYESWDFERLPGRDLMKREPYTEIDESLMEATVKLRDIYDEYELRDETEIISNYIDDEDLNRDFVVHTMTPDEAKTYTVGGDNTPVIVAFKHYASKDQKRLVREKVKHYDHSRIIVVINKTVLDGNHQLMAGIIAKQPIKYIDLADYSVENIKESGLINHTEKDDKALNADMEHMWKLKNDQGLMEYVGALKNFDLYRSKYVRGYRYFFVSTKNPIGFAIVQNGGRTDKSTQANFHTVTMIYIKPDHRKSGLASAFYNYLFKQFKMKPDTLQTTGGKAIWDKIDRSNITEATRRFYYHVTLTKNLKNIKRIGLEPRIGTLSAVAGEARPRIYLFSSLEDVENALENWLGDYLPDDVPLALLKISLPIGVRPRKDAFEYQVFSTIPPQNIQILSTDIDTFEFPNDWE